MNNLYDAIPTDKFKSLVGYRKRKIRACKFDSEGERVLRTASYWDGGSKSDYLVINLDNNKETIPPAGEYPNFSAYYPLKQGEMMIEYGIFMGKQSTARVSYFPSDSERVKQYFN